MTAYDATTALLVVDVQNDFADPEGGLYVPGGEQVVPIAAAAVATARAGGALVAYTQDWHPPTTPHFAKDGGIWPVHCVRDTWGAALHPDLPVDGPVVRKGRGGEDGYSGFSLRDPQSGRHADTELDGLLRSAGVRRVVVVGLAGDYCVKETALDAARLGYEVEVPLAATRFVALADGDEAAAVDAMHAAGVLVR